VTREEALGGVGKGFAGAVEAAAIGRDEAVALRGFGGYGEAGGAGGGDAGTDESASG
jgi:hypothetical protein